MATYEENVEDARMTTCGEVPAAETDEVLEAVLSFLDEHDITSSWSSPDIGAISSLSDADTASSGDGSHDSPSEEASDSPALRRRKNVRSDKRQREEVLALREEALALEDRLVDLQERLMSNYSEDETCDDAEGVQRQKLREETRKLRAQTWHAVVDVQMRRRRAAESERNRLRALIKEQKNAFRSLRRYLARHMDKAAVDAAMASHLMPIDLSDASTDSASDDDQAHLDELSRALPTMYLQTGAVLSDARLDSVVTAMQDLKVQNEQSAKMSIEALESRIIPFDVTTTAAAVWKHHLTSATILPRVNSAKYASDPSVEAKLEVTDDRIRRVFTASMYMDGAVAAARGRVEIRRYIEENRVVIVESMFVDRIHVDGNTVPEFAVRQFQWTVIGPPRHPLLRDSGRALSQVEIYGVGMPTMKNAPDEELNAAQKLDVKKRCVEAVRAQLEFERQSVENILLAQAIQGAGIDQKMFGLS